MSDSDNRSPRSSSDSGADNDVVTAILTKNKRRREALEDREDEETMIDDLFKEMLQAADEDDAANQESLPALNKLKMLGRVGQFLKIVKYHETFLAMEGCVVLARWLSPMPDGSIPCNVIRQSILEALQVLPVSTDNLQRSELGKLVMGIYKSPVESAGMKKLSKALVDKWSRAIYDINIDYAALEDSERIAERPSGRAREASNMHQIIAQDMPTNHIRIPQRGMHDYKYRPVSRFSEQESKPVQDIRAVQLLQKSMMKRKRSIGRKTTGPMSADGRGLHF
jgi:hypothetical protein